MGANGLKEHNVRHVGQKFLVDFCSDFFYITYMEKYTVKIYRLIATDLTHLGGPTGSEYTTRIFTKYFQDIDIAKAYAQEHYKPKSKWFDWKQTSSDKPDKEFTISFGDLGFVMYDISPIELED